jgi:RNA recognition motif-containing protein
MSTKLYVGNLGFGTTESQVRDAFAEFGQLASVSVITDRATGQSRGFGFVEYESADSAQRAIDSMNGAMLDGRALNVNIAREREGGSRGGGGGGGGGGRGERRW